MEIYMPALGERFEYDGHVGTLVSRKALDGLIVVGIDTGKGSDGNGTLVTICLNPDEVWFRTENVSCGDTPIDWFQTDGKATAVTAPLGRWVKMRGTNRHGVVETVERAGDAWKDVA